MEESINTEDKEAGSAADPAAYSPLVLAFLGDSVYELMIRTKLVGRGNARLKDLNREKSSYVKASSQSRMMEAIEPLLTEKEESIYHRGRNARSYSSAKNAAIADYRRATGFEALIGYLYLSGEYERMKELVDAGIKLVQQEWEKSGISLLRRSRNRE